MNRNLPKRKSTRLKKYDYSTPGAYFITICTKDRIELLSKIDVGTGVLDCPQNTLTHYGKIANKHLINMSNFYDNIRIDKFVIMPNHIHLLIQITESNKPSGQSGTPVPTNSLIAKFISTFKRFCNKEYGENVWQARSNDHIIRDEKDYKKYGNILIQMLYVGKKIVFIMTRGYSKNNDNLYSRFFYVKTLVFYPFMCYTYKIKHRYLHIKE